MRAVIAVILAFIIVALCFGLAFVNRANAHTIVWPDGQTFTFDQGCCDKKDCDKLPLDAIREVPGGYQVDFWRSVGNPPRPQHFKDFVPFGSIKIKFNPFIDRIMGCHSWEPGKEPGTYKPRCIYPIQPTS